MRMIERQISENEVVEVIEHGKTKSKGISHKYWVYGKVATRRDNYICVSISVEDPHLIVITTLVNWSPEV
jgi:hypothetical protein